MDEQLIFQMAVFSLVGLGMETAATAAMDWNKDPNRHLMGYSSIWYMPLYCLTPLFLRATSSWLFALPLLVRGLVYTLAVFACEYVGMWILRKMLGSSPSEASYRRTPWNVHALIRLDFAPAWFSAGLLMEYFYRHMPLP